MPIDNLTLNDFVCTIPVCQPEADLGSILDIFRHLNCKLLAIPKNNGSWGIINSEDLLSLIAKVWLPKKIAVVSHPKMGYREDTPNLSTRNIDSIVRPAIICQSDTKLTNFLSHLWQDSLSSDRQEYLIVNPTGALQGRLNTDKMLKYLASKHNCPSNVAQSTEATSLIHCLNAISLPLKVENFAGEEIYHNQCWQELAIANLEEQHPPIDDIASWWLERKSPQTQKPVNVGSDLEAKHNRSTDCHIISDLDIYCSKTQRAQPSTKFTPRYCDRTNSQLNIQIEQVQDWNYIKVPLTLTGKRASGENPLVYWLVLATKLPVENLQYGLSANSPASNTVTDQLLETVAHELKSPLMGVLGLTSLLEEQKLGKLNQRQTDYVQLIANSGRKMMSIVKNLIELTSLTAERSPSKPEPINLPALCQQAYQRVITELDQSTLAKSVSLPAIELDLTIESGTETAIADLSRLSSILFHLIVETIQFSETVDTVSIKIKRLPGTMAIEIANNSDSDLLLSASESRSVHFGLNWIIAKYLAETLEAKVSSVGDADCCQFTLTLPQDDLQNDLSPSSLKITANNIQKNLTILCLYPEPEAVEPQKHSKDLDFELKNWSSSSEQSRRYRIIEADSLEQADMLARIWQLDVIVLNGYQIIDPGIYLRSLQESESLSTLPLITLDIETTQAANQISGLSVYPCLLPAKHRSLENLFQVIQIATGLQQQTIE